MATSERSDQDRGPISSARMLERAPSLAGFPLAVFNELRLHISEPNCRAILYASADAAGTAIAGLHATHVGVVIVQIEKTFDVFGVRKEVKARCIDNLRTLAGPAGAQRQTRIPIAIEDDIVQARTLGKRMCQDLGFSEIASVKVATVISELARNIIKFARSGEIVVTAVDAGCVQVVAADRGPGIPDIDAVMSPHYRSRTGMGMGLRGTRRIMDFFEIVSGPGLGTKVTTRMLKK